MGSTPGHNELNSTSAVGVYSVNDTGNVTLTILLSVINTTDDASTPFPDLRSPYKPLEQIFISIALGLLILGTITGNTVVCIAVALVKGLQTPYNLLIVSLAVSDLLVALLVMPFAAVYQILGYWPLNDTVCGIWTSLDVTLCTASILNLCLISVDRYFVITRPFTYAVKRTRRRIFVMIAGIWAACAVISIPPLFGWKTPNPPNQCIISQKLGYQIYATLGAFYLPLFVMIVVYFKIWRVSARLAKHETKKVGTIDKPAELVNLTSSQRNVEYSDNTQIPNRPLRNGVVDSEDASMRTISRTIKAHKWTLKSLFTRTRPPSTSNSNIKRKATKALGVIMGCFVVCWLPFFILAVIRPLVGPSVIPGWLSSLLFWLGYLNSFLNPLIYVRYNRDFRTPIKEILCFRCRNIDSRVRSENYAEQYGPDRGMGLV